MSSRRNPVRRSQREWAVRLGVGAVAVVLGSFAVTFSFAQVLFKQNPALAYRLAPYDGRITAAYATSLAGVDATTRDRVRADELARRALRQDATTVAAASTLGFNAAVRNDQATSRRYFAYAQKLSRRDSQTQLFMIEDAVQRGDIPGALQQYDITLRVFPTLNEVLYPVLASASADAKIRQGLVRTLAQRPLWSDSFIDFVVSGNSDAKSMAALLMDLRRAGVAISQGASAAAINKLIAAGHAEEAWRYYARIRPGVDRRKSRDPRFATKLEASSQLDWIPINDGSGLTTSIQDGVFDFAAPASVGGPMLQQVQLLSPGSYRLSGHSTGIEQAAGALPYWALRCQTGRELGRVEVPSSTVANGSFTGTFIVPAGCPVQTLILEARASDAVSGLSGQIDRAELMPAS